MRADATKDDNWRIGELGRGLVWNQVGLVAQVPRTVRKFGYHVYCNIGQTFSVIT